MSEMYLRQSGFTYSACGSCTKNKERIQKFKETWDTQRIYHKKLEKACFQHGMINGDFKGLPRRTTSDKILRDKAFNIAKNPKYDGYQCGLTSMGYKFFDKKISGGIVENEIMSNKYLAEELHKSIIKKCNGTKVHSPFIDNIWGADQLICN